MVSDTLKSLKGPRYKSTEGFKASKVILAWVGCRSCVTTREKAHGGVRLEQKSDKTEAQAGLRGEKKV